VIVTTALPGSYCLKVTCCLGKPLSSGDVVSMHVSTSSSSLLSCSSGEQRAHSPSSRDTVSMNVSTSSSSLLSCSSGEQRTHIHDPTDLQGADDERTVTELEIRHLRLRAQAKYSSVTFVLTAYGRSAALLMRQSVLGMAHRCDLRPRFQKVEFMKGVSDLVGRCDLRPRI
jgi:hypothetical protein